MRCVVVWEESEKIAGWRSEWESYEAAARYVSHVRFYLPKRRCRIEPVVVRPSRASQSEDADFPAIAERLPHDAVRLPLFDAPAASAIRW